MSIIKFDDHDLSSLLFLEYPQTWTSIGLEQLEEDEQTLVQRFLGYLPEPVKDLNLEDLFLVKAGEGEGFDRVYAPTIYRREKNIILKVGSNEFPCCQDDQAIICGELRGSIDFDGDERSVKVKKDGKEIPCKVQNCYVSFIVTTEGSEDENIYQCPIRTNPESNPIKSNVVIALQKKRNVAQFFAEPAAQGTGATKMRDMPEGVYHLVSSKPYQGDYDPTHIVETDTGLKFWAQGLIKTALDSGRTIPKSFNMVEITSKKKSVDGSKTYVNMKLRLVSATKPAKESMDKEEDDDFSDIPF